MHIQCVHSQPVTPRPLEELQKVGRGELMYANYKIQVRGTSGVREGRGERYAQLASLEPPGPTSFCTSFWQGPVCSYTCVDNTVTCTPRPSCQVIDPLLGSKSPAAQRAPVASRQADQVRLRCRTPPQMLPIAAPAC